MEEETEAEMGGTRPPAGRGSQGIVTTAPRGET